MKSILPGLLLVILHTSGLAQAVDSTAFSPDRPGFATSPAVLTFKKVQLENGFQYSNFTRDGVHHDDFLLSSLLVRYGLLKFAELRIQADLAYNSAKDSTGRTLLGGLNPMTIGTKIKLIGQRKVIPNISILFNLTLPFIGKQEFLPITFIPSLDLLMSNDLTDRMNLCYNYCVTWDIGSAVLLHFYAVSFNIQLHPKWSVFIEGYGYASLHALPSFYMDTGVAFLINDHLQLDFSASGSLTSINDYYLLSTGIAWKIPGKKKRLSRDN